ncbi:FecR family protein [Maribacter sp. LLG6340-A2]|uniref:FecR family protein n=1 Tax=Maribacter sp. LLG6340-A2 TaxID=3160834 RepID=UPI003868B786
MKNKARLIIKFLNREANMSDLQKLDKVIDKKKPKRVFTELVEIHYLLSISMKMYDSEKAKNTFKEQIFKDLREKRRNRFKKLAIAASFTLFIALLQFNSGGEIAEPEVVASEKVIEAGTDKAILTLDNGDQIVLEEGLEYNSDKVQGNGKSLEYKKSETSDSSSYNYLSVPRGGQFKLKLPDGTLVWVNSDSKLKYPTAFNKNRPREVELVFGEVFLEVSPSEKNNGTPFHLITKGQKVQVLGTQFNVRSYTNEKFVKTTLVEGSVAISDGTRESLLKPNQQSIYNKENGDTSVKEVDAMQEVSWVSGLFSFDTESLGEIMNSLARWYDVEIAFESAELKNFTFTGILERSSSIDTILYHIEESSEGKIKFVINNDTIIIQKNTN